MPRRKEQSQDKHQYDKGQVIQVLQYRKPKKNNQINLIFKIKAPESQQVAYVQYDQAVKTYPKVLIQYFTSKIIKKQKNNDDKTNKVEQKNKESKNIKNLIDCDLYDQDQQQKQQKVVPVYFKLHNTLIRSKESPFKPYSSQIQKQKAISKENTSKRQTKNSKNKI